MILPSRKQFRDSDHFVENFLDSIQTYSDLKIADYINFRQYKQTLISIFEEVTEVNFASKVFLTDDPFSVLSVAFRLVGLLEWESDSNLNNVSISILQRLVKEKDKSTINYLCDKLVELGIIEIIRNYSIEDVLVGIYLSDFSRKSDTQYKYDLFRKQVVHRLTTIFAEEQYSWNENFKAFENSFDLCLLKDNEPKIVFDIDYYTTSGSKPTRILREYGVLQYHLATRNISFVWITDGAGYFRMKNVLKKTYRIIGNIYNIHQLKSDFVSDAKSFNNQWY